MSAKRFKRVLSAGPIAVQHAIRITDDHGRAVCRLPAWRANVWRREAEPSTSLKAFDVASRFSVGSRLFVTV